MICPSCNKKVKDGTSICPHCDAVLDESILGAMPAGDDEAEDTPPPKPAPKKPVAKPAAKASTGKRPAAARKPAPVKAEEEPPEPEEEPKPKQPAPNDGKFVSKYQQYWTEDDPPAKPAAKSGPQSGDGVVAELGPVRGGHDPELVDPMDSLKNVWKGFVEAHFEDKITVASAAMLIVCNFMPWRSVDEGDGVGDQMGLMAAGGLGFFTFLLAALAITTVWARKSNVLPSMPRGRFPLATIGAGGLAALVCVITVITSFGHAKVAGREVLLTPSFGVFLAVVAAAGVVLGGMLTLKREK